MQDSTVRLALFIAGVLEIIPEDEHLVEISGHNTQRTTVIGQPDFGVMRCTVETMTPQGTERTYEAYGPKENLGLHLTAEHRPYPDPSRIY